LRSNLPAQERSSRSACPNPGSRRNRRIQPDEARTETHAVLFPAPATRSSRGNLRLQTLEILNRLQELRPSARTARKSTDKGQQRRRLIQRFMVQWTQVPHLKQPQHLPAQLRTRCWPVPRQVTIVLSHNCTPCTKDASIHYVCAWWAILRRRRI